ncbi:rod shape-determining protein [Streptomyces reniochalinae]|uniref:Cell shape-determining protein MreB n=1 Tax=Streptomyces reniochalinae TaxID=2250578 RepID=A0A367E8T0_9ACTN|nr:rod shape-determining protein [Streptomyces reniochalinae]RCG13747.1 rod shape-determining protein [Streptomyces reniochalinae]
MSCSSLEALTRCSVAVDLGAARTRVYAKGTGLIVDQPSVVAVNTSSGALIAVGDAAERMDGRTPQHIRVVRPVAGGTVRDIDMARRMVRSLIGERLRRVRRRRVMAHAAATVPHDADPLACRAAVETLTGVGARRVELVEAPIAAAIGAGLPVAQPEAAMVLVCGTTTTQVAVVSVGAIVAAGTVGLGGDTIHHAVVQYLRNRHELLLPSQEVRPLHLALLGSGGVGNGVYTGLIDVQGRDVVSGLARTVTIDPEEVRSAIQTPLTGLLDTIRTVLLRCPPDLVADLADRGMVLTGGSAVLPGLADQLREHTGMGVRLAQEPELASVNGLAALMAGRLAPNPAAEEEAQGPATAGAARDALSGPHPLSGDREVIGAPESGAAADAVPVPGQEAG